MSEFVRRLGVKPGDRVAILAPNNHVLLESHYGIPFSGAVLVPLNTRLAAGELAYIVDHAGCKLLLCDPRYIEKGRKVVEDVGRDTVLIVTDEAYEAEVAELDEFIDPLRDERSMITLNYTSGTTGFPKGVAYHHRGAYLQSLAMSKHFELSSTSTFLWTLPMFHCNGWCFTWAVTAAGGTHICLPEFNADDIWRLMRRHRVTHFCGAPTVLVMLSASGQAWLQAGQFVKAAIGGSPPTPSLIESCESLGLRLTHLYGLTETFGPVAICDWKREWDGLPSERRAQLRARQGVGNLISENLRVVDSAQQDVPKDGLTIGEVTVRGNNVMLGYYRDPEATERATLGGWFHTGDLAVVHPDSYIEIHDRASDIIVSGGENISSVEVESAIASHPAVLESAVVAIVHEKWGERPIAFVTLRTAGSVSEEEIQRHVRQRLASYKVPDYVVFDTLPKTATGKVQKFRLREAGNSMFGAGRGNISAAP